MRILAIDHGTVRTGLAISDELNITVRPYKALQTGKGMPQEIAEIVQAERVELIVLGIPFGPNMVETDATRRVRTFAETLRLAVPCPVVECDESFSSKKAGVRMLEAGIGKKRRQQKENTDLWAAAIILQEYINSL